MPAMRIFRPFRSLTDLIFLRYQPPIWDPVFPQGIGTILDFEKITEKLVTIAVSVPGINLACRHAEGYRGIDTERGILAIKVIRSCMATFNSRIFYRIKNAWSWNNFTRSEDLNLKFPASSLCYTFGHDFCATVDRVHALGKARG